MSVFLFLKVDDLELWICVRTILKPERVDPPGRALVLWFDTLLMDRLVYVVFSYPGQ